MRLASLVMYNVTDYKNWNYQPHVEYYSFGSWSFSKVMPHVRINGYIDDTVFNRKLFIKEK